MTRIYIDQEYDDYGDATDARRYWFSLEAAERFDAEWRWDGNNNVDINTGSCWTGERLYRTAQGRWVLGTGGGPSGHWQGSVDHYRYVGTVKAAEWLLFNGHDDAHRTHFGEPAEERGPGEPTA